MDYATYAESRMFEEAAEYVREAGPTDGLDFYDTIWCADCGADVFATYRGGKPMYYGCTLCGYTQYPEET